MRTRRFWITLAILFAANVLISNLLFSAGQPPTVTISYNTFLDQVNAGNVSSTSIWSSRAPSNPASLVRLVTSTTH